MTASRVTMAITYGWLYKKENPLLQGEELQFMYFPHLSVRVSEFSAFTELLLASETEQNATK